MSVLEFLGQLREKDITFRLDGTRLKCDAPAGAVTPELHAAIMQRKAEIIEFLRGAVAVQTGPRAIVPIKADGTRPPLFGFPGHNGDVFCYIALSKYLDDDQPLFGVQPPGLEGSEPLHDVTELAAYCVEQIRSAHPAGPYNLVGYCAGGTVTLEAARQLADARHEVSMVMLLGCPAPATYSRFWGLVRRVTYFSGRILVHARETLLRSPRATVERLAPTIRRILGARAETSEVPASVDQAATATQRVEAATLGAIRAFKPRRYSGTLDVVLPSKEWARSGAQPWRWKRLAARVDERIRSTPCTSDEMLLEPHVRLTAEMVNQRLRDVATPAREAPATQTPAAPGIPASSHPTHAAQHDAP